MTGDILNTARHGDMLTRGKVEWHGEHGDVSPPHTWPAIVTLSQGCIHNYHEAHSWRVGESLCVSPHHSSPQECHHHHHESPVTPSHHIMMITQIRFSIPAPSPLSLSVSNGNVNSSFASPTLHTWPRSLDTPRQKRKGWHHNEQFYFRMRNSPARAIASRTMHN